MSTGPEQPDPLAIFDGTRWRLPVGIVIYTKVEIGDHWNGRSVTVCKGTSGTLVGYSFRQVWEYVDIEMIDSIGQPTSCCRIEDLFVFWQTTPIAIPSRYRTLREGTFQI